MEEPEKPVWANGGGEVRVGIIHKGDFSMEKIE
jgi:hypothetical protein